MQPNPGIYGFTVQANSTIDAPIEHVWSVLVDLAHYAEWNTFVPLMQSSLQVGSSLIMGVQLHKKLRIKMLVTVTLVEPQHQLAWKARLPTWYLCSERFQTIVPLDADTTQYSTHETFTGLMAPLLQGMLGNYLQRKFDGLAHNLKMRAESLSRN